MSEMDRTSLFCTARAPPKWPPRRTSMTSATAMPASAAPDRMFAGADRRLADAVEDIDRRSCDFAESHRICDSSAVPAMLFNKKALLQHDQKLVEEHVLARLELEVLCDLLRRLDKVFGARPREPLDGHVVRVRRV
eukprot:CAMPEP_0184237510 /NCGR_PEP_ID=MMETSP0976-20121227/26391_1 /TAXON_ID=483370 /ORGANISM="non described non described, Strain CCMP2097" /LENGTH=135 /DNA_ID=CAMNT_0026542665 /DNA_START=89 /DNA_END=493 /DNA_ORIENTATION=-